MLGICNLSVLELCMKHCFYLFLCMAVRQCYGNEKERSRIRAVQMDNLRGFLGIRKMDRAPNARIRELCGVTKEVGERIDEGVLRWFGRVERMLNDIIVKRVFVGECAGSRSMGRLRKWWINTVSNCLRKRGLDVEEASRMVQERIELRGFVKGNAWGVARGMNP